MAGSGARGPQLDPVAWRKSRYSNPSGNCVEVSELPRGRVGVRDSQDPAGPVLVFTQAVWDAFIRAVRASGLG